MSHPRSRGTSTGSSETFEHKVPTRLMKEFNEFVREAPRAKANYVKEVAGEQYMEMTLQRRGHAVTVTPADKGVRGGADAAGRTALGRPEHLESKFGSSRLSAGQRNADKTLVADPTKVLGREGQFKGASPLQQRAADRSLKTLGSGASVDHGLYRTRSSSTNFSTKVTTRTYAAPDTGTKGGPVTVKHDAGLKSDGFAAPGRATIPLARSVGSIGARSSAGLETGHAAAGAGTRAPLGSSMSGQIAAPKMMSNPVTGPSADLGRTCGPPSSKF